MLQQSEEEKTELQKALEEARKLMEETKVDLCEQKKRADQLKSYISSLSAVRDVPQPRLPNDLEVNIFYLSFVFIFPSRKKKKKKTHTHTHTHL